MTYPGTVMFDLDGTLVPIDLDFFYKHYVREAGARFAHLIPANVFVEALMRSTLEMISNLDPGVTNHQAFAQAFSRRVGLPWEEIWPVFEEFYRNEFRNLKALVPENPDARLVVEGVVRSGWQIVLATNPLFPEDAIRERMRWVNVEDLPWRHITTLDNMHFCKPHVEYYREILDTLDLDPRSCVMVGNDIEEDMVAGKLGIRTFLVEDFLIERGGSGLKPDGRGKLRDLLSFLHGLVGWPGSLAADQRSPGAQ